MDHPMIDPTYLISTAPTFSLPFSTLVESLRAAGITKWVSFEGNSFDYTAIIGVLEKNKDVGSHVVLLHDTMEVSPETPSLVEQADPESGAVAAFGGQCNLGLYRMDWISTMREELLAFKNCSKKQAISFEGEMWRRCPTRTSYPNGSCVEIGRGKPYGNAERITEMYTALQIRKHKSNWGQTCQTGEYVLTP